MGICPRAATCSTLLHATLIITWLHMDRDLNHRFIVIFLPLCPGALCELTNDFSVLGWCVCVVENV